MKQFLFLFLLASLQSFPQISSVEINPKKSTIHFTSTFNNNPVKCFFTLSQILKKQNKSLSFAMNGGMYLPNSSPQGLYIENGVLIKAVDTIQKAFGNFYLQPNGIFAISRTNNCFVSTTKDFAIADSIMFATQSGPMLIINGEFHPAFNPNSKNLNIRNGVGILPNGNVLFAISETPINFYNFAQFFLQKGCKNALYLDGFVSKMYSENMPLEPCNSKFGCIIYTTKD